MKVAYFTPLNPKRSGISDYNEELLLKLKDYLDIHLFLDGYIPSNKLISESFPCFEAKDFEFQHMKNKYQTCIFHMGNNCLFHEYMYPLIMEYSGIIVMHDYAIHDMIAGMLLKNGKTDEYLEEIRYNNGEMGYKEAQKALKGEIRPLWETSSIKFPMNKRVIDSAKGIIVHSNFVKKLITSRNSQVPVEVIPHHCAELIEEPQDAKNKARKKLNIKSDSLMLASFGHVVPSKRIDVILRCLRQLKEDYPNFIYYIVGEETESYPVRKLVREFGLNNHVIFTGYTNLETFKTYMQAADLCLNLRYPVQGETSGSLLRLLGMGKAVVVSNEGSFSELPDDVVVKTNVDEEEEQNLIKKLKHFSSSPGEIKQMGSRALQYVKQNCTLEDSAYNYSNFIKEIVNTYGAMESVTAHRLIGDISENFREIGITAKNSNLIFEVASLLDEVGIG